MSDPDLPVRRKLVLRRVAIVFFAAYAAGVTFPVVSLFRGPRPFVFGFPLPMMWVTFWVVAGGAVLWLLDHAYRATAGADPEPTGTAGVERGR